MLLDTLSIAMALAGSLLWSVVVRSALSPRSLAALPGETPWETLDRTTGHRFRGEGYDRQCATCGTELAPWRERRYAGLFASRCQGPYREPAWLRALRWVAS